MMSLDLTDQQSKIINETNNTVVIAKPGSGKTFVLSHKIKKILPDLYEYQGVAAISYTNKASDELRHRCLNGGVDKKGSFFGTIDKFYISEIIMPFGKHIWGMPTNPLTVISLRELPSVDQELLSWIANDFEYSSLDNSNLNILKAIFLKGNIVLEAVGFIALYIFANSSACRKYLKARYTHIIIDEYQDAGKEQHEIFIRLQALGLCAIAVGDTDQSIYGFSGKDSRHLLSLAKHPDFVLYPLTLNHRSHPSIVNYSTGILTTKFEHLEADEIRVFAKFVNGNEADIAVWIDLAISYYARIYKITKLKDIGILVRGNRTGEIIDQTLRHKHKLFVNTPLDDDTNIWSSVFSRLLKHMFNSEDTKFDFIEEFIDIEASPNKARQLIRLIENVKPLFIDVISNLAHIIGDFNQIASILFPSGGNRQSVELLNRVLQSMNYLNSYKPAQDDEIQIMTIHKSKGLEFTLVFHLDLYEWILPGKGINNADSSKYYFDKEQDLNLHYVGVTRAKECCVLCCSSQRHNHEMQIKGGNYSEFYSIPGLDRLRILSPI